MDVWMEIRLYLEFTIPERFATEKTKLGSI